MNGSLDTTFDFAQATDLRFRSPDGQPVETEQPDPYFCKNSSAFEMLIDSFEVELLRLSSEKECALALEVEERNVVERLCSPDGQAAYLENGFVDETSAFSGWPRTDFTALAARGSNLREPVPKPKTEPLQKSEIVPRQHWHPAGSRGSERGHERHETRDGRNAEKVGVLFFDADSFTDHGIVQQARAHVSTYEGVKEEFGDDDDEIESTFWHHDDEEEECEDDSLTAW